MCIRLVYWLSKHQTHVTRISVLKKYDSGIKNPIKSFTLYFLFIFWVWYHTLLQMSLGISTRDHESGFDADRWSACKDHFASIWLRSLFELCPAVLRGSAWDPDQHSHVRGLRAKWSTCETTLNPDPKNPVSVPMWRTRLYQGWISTIQ